MTETSSVPAASHSVSGVNPFTLIHKSIRLALAETLIELGRTDFTRSDAVRSVLQKLDDVLFYCERHLEHEERFVRPACAGRFSLSVFDRGHSEQERLVARLRLRMASLNEAQPGAAPSLGADLYLEYSAFVADCLAHMTEEEQIMAPAMVQTLSEQEQAAIQARIGQALQPAEAAKAAYLMIVASNRAERFLLLEKLLLQAPRAQVSALIEQARPRLEQTDYAELMRFAEQSNAA